MKKPPQNKEKPMEKQTKIQTAQKQQLDVLIKMIWAVCAYSVFLAVAVLMSPKTAPVRQVVITPTPTVDFKSVQDAARVVYTPETWESEFSIEDEVTTSFTVSNLSNSPQNLKIIREIPSEEVLVEYPEGTLKEQQLEHITIPYLEYDVSLDSDESKTIEVRSTYTIVPPMGSFDLPKISVIDADSRKRVASSSRYERIPIQCQEDGVCNTSIRENSLNCPNDCSTGEEDDLCDRQEDDKCDPDCLTELDPDCKEGEGITQIPSVPRMKTEMETEEVASEQITEAEIRQINEDFLDNKIELLQSAPKQPANQDANKLSFNVLDLIATEVLADEDNPDEVDMNFSGIPFDPDAKPGKFCQGGTPAGECSEHQPWYCTEQMESVQDCLRCGCSDTIPGGMYCQPDGTCENIPYGYCADGTIIGECSTEEWPRWCNFDGELVLDCNHCGCPDIPTYSCNEETGLCSGCGDGMVDEGEECDSTGGDCTDPDDSCYLCQCVSEHVPSDTTCQTETDAENYTIDLNESWWSCSAMTVTSAYGTNFLDYIVDDALDCCTPPGSNVAPRHWEYCLEAHEEDPQTSRDCLARYIGTGLDDGFDEYSSMGNDILWIANYFVPELCCNNQAEVCEFFDGVPLTCSPDYFLEPEYPYSDYIQGLTCSQFDCAKHDQPALKTAALINSGTCVDWTFLTTTLLRKTGYFPASSGNGDAVFGVTKGDGTHTYNLVWMDMYGKWVIMDYGQIKLDPPENLCSLDSCDNLGEDDYHGHDNYALCLENWRDWTRDNVYGCE